MQYRLKINVEKVYYGHGVDHLLFGYQLFADAKEIKKEECKYEKLKNCLKNAGKELEKILKE